jgi:hypothetical protein
MIEKFLRNTMLIVEYFLLSCTIFIVKFQITLLCIVIGVSEKLEHAFKKQFYFSQMSVWKNQYMDLDWYEI